MYHIQQYQLREFITPSFVKLSFQQPLPKSFGDCRLVVVRGQYYLCLPVDAPKHQIENKHRIVALDPGVRNFLTLFSENSFGWIGSNPHATLPACSTKRYMNYHYYFEPTN